MTRGEEKSPRMSGARALRVLIGALALVASLAGAAPAEERAPALPTVRLAP